jgi:tetratricopeptide (TPR) repeat protein
MRSDFVEAYINLGDILIRQSRLSEAVQIYKRGLALSQSIKNADLYYNLGVVHSMILKKLINKTNTTEEVLQIAEYFLNATLINANHKESLVNLAILTQQYQTLLKPFRKSLIEKMKQYSGIDRELVYFNLAILLTDEGDNESAVYYLKQAIHIKKDFRSALFNLALIMIENESYSEAEHYLNQLLEFHPNHTKSLLILANIYINQLKNLDRAEKVCFQIYFNIQAINPFFGFKFNIFSLYFRAI